LTKGITETEKEAADWVTREDPGWKLMERFGGGTLSNFVIDDESSKRILIRFYRKDSDGSVCAKLLFGPGAQGPPGHAHGGGITSVLDEAMGAAAWMAGYIVVAAELTIRFRKMVPLGVPCFIETKIISVRGRRVRMGSELRNRKGEVLSEGKGLFITLKPTKMQELTGVGNA